MTTVKFTPAPFGNTFSSLVDELVSDFPGFFKQPFNNPAAKVWAPVNVKQTEDGYRLEMFAPGLEKKDFNISIEKDLLTITATVSGEAGKDVKYVRQEFRPAGFKRSFTLDEKTDATRIEASYVNGVLALNLPNKAEVKQPVTSITIQ